MLPPFEVRPNCVVTPSQPVIIDVDLASPAGRQRSSGQTATRVTVGAVILRADRFQLVAASVTEVMLSVWAEDVWKPVALSV